MFQISLYLTLLLLTPLALAQGINIDCTKANWIASVLRPQFGGLTPTLVGIASVESDFNQNVRTGSSVGLMQVNTNHFGNGRCEYNKICNLVLGSSVLKQYVTELKSLDKGIMAYNVGITRFKRSGGGYNYLQRVNKRKQLYLKECT